MSPYFVLLVLPLYLAWFCLGRLAQQGAWGKGFGGSAYAGVVVGGAALLLPVPWLALRTLLPAASPLGLLLWLALLLSGILYPLLGWLLTRYPVPALRRGLLWTADASLLGWLLYGWL